MAVHAAEACSANFQALAARLTNDLATGNRDVALARLNECVERRFASRSRAGPGSLAADQAHQDAIDLVNNLYVAISNLVESGEISGYRVVYTDSWNSANRTFTLVARNGAQTVVRVAQG